MRWYSVHETNYDELEARYESWIREQELIADECATALEEEAGQDEYANPHYDFPNPHSDL